MVEVRLLHTAHCDAELLDSARALLLDAFDGDFADADWEHCLGGLHAFAHADGTLVGHGALVQRRLLHAGRALRTGYVEGVAVRAEFRRRGVAGAVMAELERVVGAAYELGALAASEDGLPFYTARGWLPWRGPTHALTPHGTERTAEEDGAVLVLPGPAPLSLDAPLTCDWRDGDLW
ncbi:GNAT family N-acetyltransferase [Streptomyces sp. TRM70308]|uniref:GNAT family N-acetyltransferase n=1 Tax=Streptomyces sp. TRM70308 TaxID=3131932 RepID=UPI003D06EEF2